ncbi:MAG: AlpA family phage regulatory protein [Stagnimonas sp.]|nr:AlpA family phage regulatory protein [Stagnimonas sp.]
MSEKTEIVLHASVNRLLSLDDTLLIVGLGRTTWLQMVESNQAPAPVKLSAKIVRWRLSDLQHWVSQLQTAA